MGHLDLDYTPDFIAPSCGFPSPSKSKKGMMLMADWRRLISPTFSTKPNEYIVRLLRLIFWRKSVKSDLSLVHHEPPFLRTIFKNGVIIALSV